MRGGGGGVGWVMVVLSMGGWRGGGVLARVPACLAAC